MGREERIHQAQRMAEWERAIGPVREFGSFAEGCPKCGFPQRAYVYCTGKAALDDDPKQCPIPNEHLHAQCAMCRHGWLEEPKDAKQFANTRLVLAALLRRSAKTTIEIPLEELEEVSKSLPCIIEQDQARNFVLVKFVTSLPEQEPAAEASS